MSNLVFYIRPLAYTTGQLLRAGFYNGDTGLLAFDMALAETVLFGASSYSGTASSSATNFTNSILLPYFVAVRSVTAQTTVSFNDATSAKPLTAGDVDYLVNGAWSAGTIALALGGTAAVNANMTLVNGFVPQTVFGTGILRCQTISFDSIADTEISLLLSKVNALPTLAGIAGAILLNPANPIGTNADHSIYLPIGTSGGQIQISNGNVFTGVTVIQRNVTIVEAE